MNTLIGRTVERGASWNRPLSLRSGTAAAGTPTGSPSARRSPTAARAGDLPPTPPWCRTRWGALFALRTPPASK